MEKQKKILRGGKGDISSRVPPSPGHGKHGGHVPMEPCQKPPSTLGLWSSKTTIQQKTSISVDSANLFGLWSSKTTKFVVIQKSKIWRALYFYRSSFKLQLLLSYLTHGHIVKQDIFSTLGNYSHPKFQLYQRILGLMSTPSN